MVWVMKVTHYREINWQTWKPVEKATLLFVMRGKEILLIHKKKGLGAGNINGPGGRLDPGETPYQCAIREVQEELCITPTGVKQIGELLFQFTNGHSIHGYVFTATGFEGEPTETDEAIPIWMRCDEMPYHRMWADDRIWVPLMLKGQGFRGQFLFDDTILLGCELEVLNGTNPAAADKQAPA